MLCIRWLDLYGGVPQEPFSQQSWGFTDPCDWWRSIVQYQSRQHSRKLFEFETQRQREVAAEVFPMEVGSLLARKKHLDENKDCVIGLIMDPVLSDLRRIYPQDCYSSWNEQSQQLEAGRDHLQSWSGWGHARTAWNAYDMEKRLRRHYTEGFIKNPTPTAMVVYGNVLKLEQHQRHYIKKFQKNGYPVYFLQTTSF